MLSIKNLSVSVSGKNILKNISYEFKKNHIYVLMGPNGSGKSTLAYALAGHPNYEVDLKSRIVFENADMLPLSPDKRAKQGFFLSFQTPLSLQGVSVFQLLRVALQGVKDAFILKQKVIKLAKRLKIPSEIIERPLNSGASGGEKKKLEVLQAGILEPKVAIFDEVDTGVDVDALKTICTFINTFKKGRIIIFITHNARILKYVSPDRVLVLKDGELKKDGGINLIHEIERSGFSHL